LNAEKLDNHLITLLKSCNNATDITYQTNMSQVTTTDLTCQVLPSYNQRFVFSLISDFKSEKSALPRQD